MWTTPISYTTGDTVTATIMNVYWRDNLRFLYEPPRMRALNESNTTLEQQGVWQGLDFSRTVYDNDGMHGGVATGNEPEGGLITPQTVGIYMVAAQVGFAISTLGARHAAIAKRAVGASAWTVKAQKSIGDNGGIIRNTLAVATFTHSETAAGYQFAVRARANDDATETITVIADQLDQSSHITPFVSAHWRGHH